MSERFERVRVTAESAEEEPPSVAPESDELGGAAESQEPSGAAESDDAAKTHESSGAAESHEPSTAAESDMAESHEPSPAAESQDLPAAPDPPERGARRGPDQPAIVESLLFAEPRRPSRAAESQHVPAAPESPQHRDRSGTAPPAIVESSQFPSQEAGTHPPATAESSQFNSQDPSPDLPAIVESLLFLSQDPVKTADLAEATDADPTHIEEALAQLQQRQGGLVLREIGGGWTLASIPEAEKAARRLLAKPRTPPLTQAQAECLSIVAYLQPVSRPEITRIRGVASESAVATLEERGLIEDCGRSQFGAILYRTTPLFQRLFGLASLAALPDPAAFDPSPEEEGELRERLLRAGEIRAGIPATAHEQDPLPAPEITAQTGPGKAVAGDAAPEASAGDRDAPASAEPFASGSDRRADEQPTPAPADEPEPTS